MSRRYFPIRQTFKHDATPTNTGPQRLGSPFSQARAEVGKGLKRAKIASEDPTTSMYAKVQNFGHAGIFKPFEYARNPTHSRAKRFGAGTGGVITAIPTAVGIGAGLGLVGTTATVGTVLGAGTLAAAPVVGAVSGLGVGAVKGGVEAIWRPAYGGLKLVKRIPMAIYQGSKYNISRRRFRKRTGFNNRTLSSIDKLTKEKNKAEQNLQSLIDRQAAKSAKKILTEKQQKRYLKDYNEFTKKITNKEAEIETEAERKLSKARTKKYKKGDKEEYMINARKKHEESNVDYATRIKAIKQTGETDDQFKERLDSYNKRKDESKDAYLKRRIGQITEITTKQYNEAITKDKKAEQQKYIEQIEEYQRRQAEIPREIEPQDIIINDFTANKAKYSTDKGKYTKFMDAVKEKAKLEKEKANLEKGVVNYTRYLLGAQADEQRILANSGLIAKKERMERRGRRLEETRQELRDAGLHIVSPITSMAYGTAAGWKSGVGVGREALHYGSLGGFDKGSNKMLGIRQSARHMADFTTGTISDTQPLTANQQIAANKLNKRVQKMTQKVNTDLQEYTKPLQPGISKRNAHRNDYQQQKANIINTKTMLSEKVEKLQKIRDDPARQLSTTQQIELDNLIKNINNKIAKFDNVLLEIDKRTAGTLPSEKAAAAAAAETAKRDANDIKRRAANAQANADAKADANAKLLPNDNEDVFSL